MSKGRRPKTPADKTFAAGVLVDTEFRPPIGAPECPEWLLPEAKTEWARIVEQLAPLGVLSTVDLAVLSMYCQTFAKWRDAELMYQEHTAAGAVELSLKFARLGELLSKQLKSIITELGFTPAARSKVRAGSSADKGDEFDDFDKG